MSHSHHIISGLAVVGPNLLAIGYDSAHFHYVLSMFTVGNAISGLAIVLASVLALICIASVLSNGVTMLEAQIT